MASLVEVVHPCGDTPGSIAFELTGENPDAYTYYWTHGPQTLRLTNLGPGTYTFVVRDPYGCEESCDVTLLGALSCDVSYDVLMSQKYCEATIRLRVTDANGQEYPEWMVDVVWDDGDPSGLIRTVTGEPGSSYCFGVTVSIAGQEGLSCCSKYLSCILVQFGSKCNQNTWEFERVIVNELHRSAGGQYQFVELLVLGDGICGDSMDLRGYKLDDNEGTLIQGNDFVNYWNKEEIGIDEGFLEFSQDSVWSAVPHGSLLVLYGDRASVPADFPADDPLDADGDGVYVLSVFQPGAFTAREGEWDESLGRMTYGGWPVSVSWDVVNLSSPADGMQVRDTGGVLVHGISLGQSAFAEEGAYELWLGPASTDGMNCRFTGTDWKAKEDFTCLSADSGVPSPGLPNSIQNDSLISYLRSCDTSGMLLLQAASKEGFAAKGRERRLFPDLVEKRNKALAYPNPYEQILYVKVDCTSSGLMTIRIWSISGVLLFEQEKEVSLGSQVIKLQRAEPLPSQMLFVEVRFPDGERKVLRVVHE